MVFCACGNNMAQDSKMCISCIKIDKLTGKKFKDLTIKDYTNKVSVKGKHKSWTGSHIRLFNKSWNRHLINLPCAICKYDKHVELAHIKPVSSFSGDAKLSEVNDIKNIIQLCRNCHWEFDNGHIELEVILKIKQDL